MLNCELASQLALSDTHPEILIHILPIWERGRCPKRSWHVWYHQSSLALSESSPGPWAKAGGPAMDPLILLPHMWRRFTGPANILFGTHALLHCKAGRTYHAHTPALSRLQLVPPRRWPMHGAAIGGNHVYGL